MERKRFNVFAATCPAHQLLDIIGNKWVLLILHKLSLKDYRFGELQREIGNISKKVLTNSLRQLEENALIVRRDYGELPLRVEYSLSELGRSLSDCCKSVTRWAEENMEKIQKLKVTTVYISSTT